MANQTNTVVKVEASYTIYKTHTAILPPNITTKDVVGAYVKWDTLYIYLKDGSTLELGEDNTDCHVPVDQFHDFKRPNDVTVEVFTLSVDDQHELDDGGGDLYDLSHGYRDAEEEECEALE